MFKNFKYSYLKIKKNLYSKYGRIKVDIGKVNIEKLIKKKKSNYLAKYNDCLINDSIDEFLKNEYHLQECLEKLGDLANYYKNYLDYFCRPFFTNFHFNRIIENYYDSKAELFYNENYGNDEKENKRKNNNYILIFNETIRKSIENPTQSTLKLNSGTNDLCSSEILNEEAFLTSQTQKNNINEIINIMDKKILKPNNYENSNNENSFKISSKGLFNIYKKNQTGNILIKTRENSSNEEKSKLNQFKKIKSYVSNFNLRTKKYFGVFNQDNSVKNQSVKNSIKLNSNKNINISTLLDSKKNNFNKKAKKSFSLNNNKNISNNIISTFMNNYLEHNKYKLIKKKINSSNSYKDYSSKNSIDSKSIKNIKYIKLKGNNNVIQPLNILYISNNFILSKKLKKQQIFPNQSLENLTKNIKNINHIIINSNLGNNLYNNNNNNSLSNLIRKSRNKSDETKKNLNDVENNFGYIKINNIKNKKFHFHSPNFYNMKNVKSIINNENRKLNNKKTDKNIYSNRLDISNKKKIVFSPIYDNKF